MGQHHMLRTYGGHESGAAPEFQYIRKLADGGHVLRDIATGELDVWVSNPCQRGMIGAVKYKNTALEFAHGYKGEA